MSGQRRRLSLCQEYRVSDPLLLIARERLAAMSAFTPKADIDERERHVRFVPIADIRLFSFDRLIDAYIVSAA